MTDSVLLEAREAELRRLRDGLDTIDWLLHDDRLSSNPQIAKRMTKGEGVKRDVVELVRALLGEEWLTSRGIVRALDRSLVDALPSSSPGVVPRGERT